MKGIEIIEAIQDVDDWMIEDAKSYQKRVHRWLEWCSIAVCFCCLLLIGAWSVHRLFFMGDVALSSPAALASVNEPGLEDRVTISSIRFPCTISVPDKYEEHILVDTPFYYDYEAAGHEVDAVMNQTNVVFSLYVEHNAENHINGVVWFITASPNYSSIPYEYDEFSEDGMLLNYTMLGVDEEYEYMLWHSGHPTMACFDFWSLEETETYLTYCQDSIEILESFITDNGLEADPQWKQRFTDLTMSEVEERIEYLRKSAALYGPSSVAVESYYRCAAYDTTTEELGSVDFSIEGTFVPDGDNYVFHGSIFVIDDEESEGGDLEDALFHRVSDDYISGTIFYYDEVRKRYDAMGVLFWNLNEDTFYIQNEDSYIYYPNDNVNALMDQLDALNMAY